MFCRRQTQAHFYFGIIRIKTKPKQKTNREVIHGKQVIRKITMVNYYSRKIKT